MSADFVILLIEHDGHVLTYLSNMLRQADLNVITAPSGKEGLIEAWRNRPQLIIVDGELGDLNSLDLVRKLRADHRTGQAQLWLLSARANPEAILAGMQAGANEYLVKRPGAESDLLARVQKTTTATPEAEVAAPVLKGQMIAFLSAKGGTGTSSLCANMAQIMVGQAGNRSVAVVDLVLPIGSIGQIVGNETGSTIVDLSRLEAAQLTPETMRQHTAPVPNWGFHLLRGSPDPETAQNLQVGQLEAVFNALRQTFDFVFIDFGRALSRISLPLIRASARTVLILSSDHAAVALTKTTLKYLELHGIRRNYIFPILNRAVGLEGMNKTEIEQELALSIPGMLPYMGGSMALANNMHQAVSQKFPNDSAAFSLHTLTTTLLTQLETKSTRPLPA